MEGPVDDASSVAWGHKWTLVYFDTALIKAGAPAGKKSYHTSSGIEIMFSNSIEPNESIIGIIIGEIA